MCFNFKNNIMKKTCLILCLFVALKSNAQISFGVSPGFSFNSSYIGYSVNDRLITYLGFQYFNANFKYKESGERFDDDLFSVVNYTESEKFSANVYLPSIGLKYFALKQDKIQAYGTINFTKPILKLKVESEYYDTDEVNNINSNLVMFGGEMGIGVEYFFDKNFSVGGEFGFRYFNLKYRNEFENDFYNYDTQEIQNTTIKNEFSFNTSPTYSKISFNYYFTKKINEDKKEKDIKLN